MASDLNPSETSLAPFLSEYCTLPLQQEFGKALRQLADVHLRVCVHVRIGVHARMQEIVFRCCQVRNYSNF